MKLRYFLALLTITTLAVSLKNLAVSVSAAGTFPTYEQCEAQGKKLTICHATSSETNPYNRIEIACDALYGRNGHAGHLSENGTTQAGHEDDQPVDNAGLCPGEARPTPTPSITPSPSATPTIIIDPSPTPSISPNPSISPDPNSGKHSALGVDVCCDDTFDAVYDVTENGKPIANIEVTFTYNPTLTARTNENGRAKVTFPKRGDRTVSAQADGYPTQSLFVTMPTNCPAKISEAGIGGTSTGQVLGANTDNSSIGNSQTRGIGQVLGASTLADTGSARDGFAKISLIFGLVLMLGSSYGYSQAKTKKSKK